MQAVNTPTLSEPPVGQSKWTAWHTIGLAITFFGVALVEILMPPSLQLVSWLSAMLLMAGFACIAGHGVTGTWLGVFIDTRNKVSLSRFQMTLWTIMVLSAFLTAVLANIEAGLTEPMAITIPPELWVLMGITTASMVGSPIILSVKRRRVASEEDKRRTVEQLQDRLIDPNQIAFLGQLVVNQHVDAARISDLFQGSETGNAGLLDLGKLQMLFFTLILHFAYGTTLAGLFATSQVITSLPAMDAGMLALLGISHAGYLVNKALPQTGSD